jgi:methionyl-tRNA formyltransferase
MENYRIIFIGTPEFGAIILKKLIKDYKPILVITNPDKPKGRKNVITQSPVKQLAIKNNIPVQHDFENLECDLIITAAYGKIIPKDIIELPKYGCLNVHPSLLPKYRGASPIQTAILNGEKETGVSIMLMDEKMDHGPILAQIKHRIDDKDYPTLEKELAEKGAELLLDIISKYIEGKIKPKEQDHNKATFCKIIKKEDGLIDFNKSPKDLERQVKAFNPWPGVFTFDKKSGKRIKILEVKVFNNELIIKKVQPEGKKPMDYNDYLKGYDKLF